MAKRKRKSKPRAPPFKPLQEILDKFGADARRAVTDVGPQIAEMLLHGVDDVFEAEGIKPRFRKLAESTDEHKPTGLKILELTGELRDSFQTMSEAEDIRAFTDNPYARFHVTGTKTMPKRNFLRVDFDLIQFNAAEVLLHEITGKS